MSRLSLNNKFIWFTKMIKVNRSILTLFFLSAVVISAQPKKYSLQQLLHFAINNNTDMRISRGNNSIIKMEKTKVQSGLLPQINAEGSYIYSSEKNGVPTFVGANGRDEIFALLSMRQTIFDPTVINDFKTSSIKAEEQVFINEQTKQNVISQVIDAYFAALKYKNEQRVLKENLEAFRLLYKQSQLLFTSGSVPEIDVKKSKIELLLQKNSLNIANKNYISALNYLKELVGMKINDNLELASFNVSEVILDSLNIYQNSAWQNRPDWKLMNKEEELGKLNVTTSFMKHLPTISGNLYYGWDALNKLDKNNLGLQAVVTASMPLWHWGAVNAGHQIAQIKSFQTELKKKRLQLRILREIKDNYNEAKTQKEQIAAMKESISEAALAVKMARVGYKEGTITNLDLINTQKLYTQTKMEYLKALYNFYLAKVNLFKSIGELKEDLSWVE